MNLDEPALLWAGFLCETPAVEGVTVAPISISWAIMLLIDRKSGLVAEVGRSGTRQRLSGVRRWRKCSTSFPTLEVQRWRCSGGGAAVEVQRWKCSGGSAAVEVDQRIFYLLT